MNERQQSVCRWAKAHLTARDFVIVDTETTGLDGTAEVVSIAVVNAWGRVAFQSLVKPTKPIDELGTAFRINGISNAMVERAPASRHVFNPLFFSMEAPCVIAYNADFDFRMMKQSCLPLSLSGPWECAMLRYAEYRGVESEFRRGQLVWCSLQAACEQMGFGTSGYHEAAFDAEATYRLMEALAARCEE